MKRDRSSRRRLRAATLKDIAREARVSTTAVSLVLQNETNRVSAATRKRVLEIAKRLNYRPNFVARSLVTKESRSIGLVITTLQNPFYSEMAQDIIDRAKEAGYGVITCSVRGGLEDEGRCVNDLLARGVDGLIIASSLRHDPVIDELLVKDVPFVLTLRKVERMEDRSLDYIVVNNEKGSFVAVEHLIRMGHQRIGLITGPRDTSTGHDRHRGALSALDTYGLRPDAELIADGDFHRSSGYGGAKKLLANAEMPTAIFCANDHMAMGVMDRLREEGFRAPDDMAVVGFDDIEMAGLPGVDLTTVSQEKGRMGRLAVDQLLRRIRNASRFGAQRVLLDPVLVVRESCGYRRRGGAYLIDAVDRPSSPER